MNDPQAEGHMASHIERRKFLATRGGAAVAWPLAARAQQPATPVIRLLSGTDREASRLDAIWRGLNEAGYVEGHHGAIEYRGAEGRFDPERGAATCRQSRNGDHSDRVLDRRRRGQTRSRFQP